VRVTGTGHAGMRFETAGGSVLCDPWTTPAFFASWVPFPDNTQLDFVVQKRTSFPYNDASALPVIFGASTTPNLNLITCGGSWDRFAKNYSNRLVVFATLAPT